MTVMIWRPILQYYIRTIILWWSTYRLHFNDEQHDELFEYTRYIVRHETDRNVSKMKKNESHRLSLKQLYYEKWSLVDSQWRCLDHWRKYIGLCPTQTKSETTAIHINNSWKMKTADGWEYNNVVTEILFQEGWGTNLKIQSTHIEFIWHKKITWKQDGKNKHKTFADEMFIMIERERERERERGGEGERERGREREGEGEREREGERGA